MPSIYLQSRHAGDLNEYSELTPKDRHPPGIESICHALLNLMLYLWEKRVPVGMSLRKDAFWQKLFNRGNDFEKDGYSDDGAD